eukprot:SAG25_NODE_12938_length_273_cov_0.896552_1_plen_26_part_10
MHATIIDSLVSLASTQRSACTGDARA